MGHRSLYNNIFSFSNSVRNIYADSGLVPVPVLPYNSVPTDTDNGLVQTVYTRLTVDWFWTPDHDITLPLYKITIRLFVMIFNYLPTLPLAH